MEETEIFKICLEYWNSLTAELYRESPFPASPLLMGGRPTSADLPPRRQLYSNILSKVSQVRSWCVLAVNVERKLYDI